MLDTLRTLSHCIRNLNDIRPCLSDALETFQEVLDHALSDSLMILSGIASEQAAQMQAGQTDSVHNTDFILPDEPLSHADAVRDLPEFINLIEAVLNGYESCNDETIFQLGLRAHTFATLLEPASKLLENDQQAE